MSLWKNYYLLINTDFADALGALGSSINKPLRLASLRDLEGLLSRVLKETIVPHLVDLKNALSANNRRTGESLASAPLTTNKAAKFGIISLKDLAAGLGNGSIRLEPKPNTNPTFPVDNVVLRAFVDYLMAQNLEYGDKSLREVGLALDDKEPFKLDIQPNKDAVVNFLESLEFSEEAEELRRQRVFLSAPSRNQGRRITTLEQPIKLSELADTLSDSTNPYRYAAVLALLEPVSLIGNILIDYRLTQTSEGL